MRFKKVLTPERRSQVRDLMAHDGWKSFVELLEGSLLSDMAKDVLSANIDKGSSTLVIKKAQYEGALKFLKGMEQLKEAMRDASEDRDE